MNFFFLLPVAGVLGSFLHENHVKSNSLKGHVIRQFVPFVERNEHRETPAAVRTLARYYVAGDCTPNPADPLDKKTKKAACCLAHKLLTHATDVDVTNSLQELDRPKLAKKLAAAYKKSMGTKKETNVQKLFEKAHEFERVVMKETLKVVLSSKDWEELEKAYKEFAVLRDSSKTRPLGFTRALQLATGDLKGMETDEGIKEEEEDSTTVKKQNNEQPDDEVRNKNEPPSTLAMVVAAVIVFAIIGAVFYVRFVFIPNMAQKAAFKISAKFDSSSSA